METVEILLTGANGQLGMEIRRAFEKTLYNNGDVVVFYTTHNDLDISDETSVKSALDKFKPQIVINCAAYTNVDKAETDIDNAMKVNYQGPKILADACRERGCYLIHISTDYVFGGQYNTPIPPDTNPTPTGVYGMSKCLGEKAIVSSMEKDYLILRTSWLYSSYGNNFVKKMLKRLLNSEDDSTIKVVCDQTGSPTYAADLADFIVELINTGQYHDVYGIYHYCNRGACTWYDFTLAIRDMCDSYKYVAPCLSSDFPSPVKRPSYSVLSTAETFEHVMAYGTPPWRTSLKNCIDKLRFEGYI